MGRRGGFFHGLAKVREVCVAGAGNMGQLIAEWGRKTGLAGEAATKEFARQGRGISPSRVFSACGG